MNIAIELFILGITVSIGPCLAFCAPLILPYIAGTRRGWREGLVTILVFSFTRLIVYSFLGFWAGLLGRLLIGRLEQYGYLIFIPGGLLISIMGILIIFGKDPGHRLCHSLSKRFVYNNIKGPIIFGLIVGILPCLPLLGVLTYIALKTENLWQGAFYGFAFGAGKFISPIIPLGVLASVLPANLMKNSNIYNFFNRLCGFILFFIGMHMLISGIWR